MKDYSKLSDLNDFENQNPHTFFAKNENYTKENAFHLSNSPSSFKSVTIDNKPKLATIHELPSQLFKSRSTTQIETNGKNNFDDEFKIKSYQDDNSSILSEIGFNLRKENSSINCENLDKSFFCNDDINSPVSNLALNHEDPYTIKIDSFQDNKRPKELAVDAQNVSYQYSKKMSKVLNDVTLKVPLGGIYGLLGASGCGKTSLLKLVVGMHKPTEGHIRVFGSSPGITNSFIPGPGVGYMPQDISLFPDLTVAETLVFYSKINRMKSYLVLERIEFLLKLLDLQKKGNSLIKQLSGGQKRRVSLAVALVHTPPLVILDEPTVGVDPLLRQQIWEHLVKLARETALTVIITTHYIEEARQANTVGLMRFGRILVEACPQKLMRRYNRNNLEDVFLKLCMMDEKETRFMNNDESDESAIKVDDDGVHYNSSSKDSNDDFKNNKSTFTKIEDDHIPKVVISDFSLPLSPHMVREKENENFNQGAIYYDKNGQKLNQTPNNDYSNKMRTPLSPLELEDSLIEDSNQFNKNKKRKCKKFTS